MSKRKAIDDAREDARLFKIASELADDEERRRQWRVARGEVRNTEAALHAAYNLPAVKSFCLSAIVYDAAIA